MSTYRYQPGDRPLNGYTVRAPAGRGGFGEVYFAESDAGREVALKALFVAQGYDEIELRGIRHCMNLKSPHLVSIFDVKTAHDGTPFVIMEYVAGPSLRDLLNDSPQGLGPDKAAFFLREIAKGLSHLHGYGVVHRDLKPANIFYEDGYVKIGDYGLSKLMTADPVASQTITVGTVHYMAPEIGAGKYDKSIDLYALGCLLYEMLTGRVPYSGASPTEVLMKHLQAEPELDDVPETFAKVIHKALQKDPADRYASATEMVEDLFGAEHVRNSVSQLNADELSMIAQRVGRKVVVPSPKDAPPVPRPAGSAKLTAMQPPASSGPWAMPALNPALDKLDRRLNRSLGLDQFSAHRWPPYAGWLYVAISSGLALGVALPTAVMHDYPVLGVFIYLLGLGVPLGWALSRTRHKVRPGPPNPSRLAGMVFVLFTFCVAGFMTIGLVADGISHRLGDPMLAVSVISFLTLATIRWTDYTRPDRERSFAPGLAIGAGLIAALITLFMFPEFFLTAFALIVIAALGAQLLSPLGADPSSSETVTNPPHAPPLPAQELTVAPATASVTPVRQDNPQPAATARVTVESRHSRLAALLLCVVWIVMPLGGLHRFYVGKWFTGLLWLCTFGFLGIGQLIDGILIACGAFTDNHGKPVVRWELAGSPQPTASRPKASSGIHRTWTPRIEGRTNTFAILMHLAGILLMLVSLALILPTFLSIPQAITVLPVFEEFRIDVAREFGYEAWPLLIARVASIIGIGGVVIATLLIVMGRRGGMLHSLRALAAGGIFFFFAVFTQVAHDFNVVSNHGLQNIAYELSLNGVDPTSFLATLDLYLDNAIPAIIGGLAMMSVGMVLLAIPARKQPKPAVTAEVKA